MPLKRRAKATRAANWRRMDAWTSGGSWLLESKHDMISSGTDDGSSPAIRSEDPASRGGAPDSLSVSSLNIRLAHTARAFVLPGLLALTGMASPAAAQATHATVPEPLPDGCVIDHLLADDSAEYDTRATGPATVVDLSITGPSANRIDIVFIGDDYTEDTLDNFADVVDQIRGDLFTVSPFKEYRDYFNVRRIDIAAGEYSMSTSRFRTEDALEHLEADQHEIVALVSKRDNQGRAWSLSWTDREGNWRWTGVGLASATGRWNFKVFAHEFGHSFGRLDDEYDGMCQASRAPNISATGDRETLKWAHWIGVDGYGGTDLDPEETPVPASPEMYSYYLGRTVSAYQFARMATGVQRGSRSCDTLLAPRNALTRFPNRACRLRPEKRLWGCAIYRWPSPVSGLFRRKACARTVPSPSGVCHSLLPFSALPRTGFGGAVPPAPGFGRFRHLRVSGNAHKPLNFQGETHHG